MNRERLRGQPAQPFSVSGHAMSERLQEIERSNYGKTLRANARQAAQAAAILALRRQELMQGATERHEQGFIDGAGQLKMRIDWKTAQMLGVQFGRMDWWHDPEMLRIALRDNPQLRVRCVSRKVTLRVNGLKNNESGKQESRKGTDKSAAAVSCFPAFLIHPSGEASSP